MSSFCLAVKISLIFASASSRILPIFSRASGPNPAWNSSRIFSRIFSPLALLISATLVFCSSVIPSRVATNLVFSD